VQLAAKVADSLDRDLVDLKGVTIQSDERRDGRRRSRRIGQKRVRKISYQLSRINCPDYSSPLIADLRFVINKLADTGPVVIASDEKVFVRKKSGAFDGASENVGHKLSF